MQPALSLEQKLSLMDLVDEALSLLEQFRALEDHSSDLAWESVVKLQQLVEQLREKCPPKTFWPRA